MTLTSTAHLIHKYLLFLSIELEVRDFDSMRSKHWSTWGLLLIFGGNDSCNDEIEIKFWINIAKECAFYEISCLVLRSILSWVGKLGKQNVNHCINTECDCLLRVFIFQINFETVFWVISRVELIIQVILTRSRSKLAYQFHGGHELMECALQSLVQFWLDICDNWI